MSLAPHTTTLPTGLTLITIPMESVRSVTTMAMVNTGSRYEDESRAGIAHFLEHMVFKGTKQYPDAQTIARSVDAIGGESNAFTSKEYTGYYVTAASQHIQTAVSIVSDQMLQPLFRQEDIDRESGVIIEEINMYADTPARQVGVQFESLLYAGGLKRDVLGTKETVASLTTADFQAFMNEWYGQENMVLVLAGDSTVVDHSDTLAYVTECFDIESNRSGKKDVRSGMKTTPFTFDLLSVQHKDTEQAHLVLGWPQEGRHAGNKHARILVATILGGTMSSRLFSEVREKRGLCYYVHSDSDVYHDSGSMGASAGVDPTRIHEALEVITSEFAATADGSKPLTTEELETAKAYISGSTTLRMESSKSVAQHFGLRRILEDSDETVEETLEKINAVSLKQVNELCAKLFQPGAMRLAVIGPYKDEDEFRKYTNLTKTHL
ncbi:MAG: insulinase family protein [Pseudomonadales bacterium]|nr:insulinase family protein [Candidatus Woesebacteria bacterium]MCB9801890.1 insulinase family protein [Pseudomonadales bacterium]